jgi:hypothetical protein
MSRTIAQGRSKFTTMAASWRFCPSLRTSVAIRTRISLSILSRFLLLSGLNLDTPWQLAAGSDVQHPRLAHLQTPAARFMNWYIRKVHQAAAVDPSVGGAFMRVQNLIDPPRRLFGPATMSNVLLANLRRSGHALFNGWNFSRGTMRQSA